MFHTLSADVKQANKKGQNQQFNRAVQNYFYSVLEDAHEGAAKQSLTVLIELWRRQVWRDARTVNVIGDSSQMSSYRHCVSLMRLSAGHKVFQIPEATS